MFCKGYEPIIEDSNLLLQKSRLVVLRVLTVTVCMGTYVLEQHGAFVFREVMVVT